MVHRVQTPPSINSLRCHLYALETWDNPWQVRSLFRQAHGGRHRGKMVWRDMIAFYEEMEVSELCGLTAVLLVFEFLAARKPILISLRTKNSIVYQQPMTARHPWSY